MVMCQFEVDLDSMEGGARIRSIIYSIRSSSEGEHIPKGLQEKL